MSQWKDSEIGFIPREWQLSTLDDISDLLTDGSHLSPKETSEGKYMASVKDMRYSGFDFVDCKKISNHDYEKLKQSNCYPQKGDILISKDGANCLDIIFVYNQKEEIVLLSSIAILRLKRQYYPYFYNYYLLSPVAQKIMRGWFISGSAIPRVVLKDFKKVPVPQIPFSEQKQIADVLSCLDEKIENLRRQNETLEQIAQKLFKHWFIDFEFPNADSKPYKSSGGAMIASDLGDIPDGWKSGKLENFCTVFRGSSPRPISSPVFFENGNIPWIKIADATRSNSIYLSETREHCTEAALPYTRLLKKGSLILSNSATVGVPMILNLEGCIHDGWLSFKDYKVITRNFLFFVLVNKLSFLMQYADGSVQKNLNTGILNNMDFILPSLELITKFTNFSQSIFDKILSNENQISTLTKTRDSLLPKLMSGQLRVKE